jgi:hypothetical protein
MEEMHIGLTLLKKKGIAFGPLTETRTEGHVLGYPGYLAVSQLRRFVDGFPPRRPGFDPRKGHVEFVDKVALE